MDSKVVNKHLKFIVWPMLAERGFTTFAARSAWRYRSRLIDVVNFQSFGSYNAERIGSTSFSFAINLGIFLQDVDDVPSHRGRADCPEEFECHVRRRVGRNRDADDQADDAWPVDEDGGNVESTVQAAARELTEIGLPWFERLPSTESILAVLREQGPPLDRRTLLPGQPDSIARHVAIGYLARAIGDRPGALAALRRCLVLIDESNRRTGPALQLPAAQTERIRNDIQALEGTK